MSCRGMVIFAPAATACSTAASAFSTYRWTVTGEPFSDLGPNPPHSGNSSVSMSAELPIRSIACISLPFGPGKRDTSTALNALV